MSVHFQLHIMKTQISRDSQSYVRDNMYYYYLKKIRESNKKHSS